MVWRRYRPYRSVWHEFDDLMEDMEAQFNAVLEGIEMTRALPGQDIRSRLVPAIRGEFRVDVKEHDDEIIVVADLPGAGKEDVNVQLVDPRTLEIRFERKEDTEEKEEGYYMRERTYGSMDRVVRLPADVSDEAGSASFRNGVLEVHLKKAAPPAGRKILVD